MTPRMRNRDELFGPVEHGKPRRIIERVYVDWHCRRLRIKILTSHLPNWPDRAGGPTICAPLDDLMGVVGFKGSILSKEPLLGNEMEHCSTKNKKNEFPIGRYLYQNFYF